MTGETREEVREHFDDLLQAALTAFEDWTKTFHPQRYGPYQRASEALLEAVADMWRDRYHEGYNDGRQGAERGAA